MTFKNKIVREWKRIVRQLAKKSGVLSPYDNFDWKHSFASEKEISADRLEYTKLNTDPSFAIDPKREWIVSHLKNSSSEHGVGADTACFIRDLWGAKWIHRNLPTIHYDCGSSFERFIAHILPMGVKVCLIDVRDLSNRYNTMFFNSLSSNVSSHTSGIDSVAGGGGVTSLCLKDCKFEQIPTISCVQADATNLKEFPDNSIESLSSLGAFGLFGLGMYGDPICPDAWKLALLSFQRVLKKGGYLYLSCSLGKENYVHFNTGRVFALQTILDVLSELEVVEVSYINHFDFDVIPIMYRENDTLRTDDTALHFIQGIERIAAVLVFKKPSN